MSSRATAPDGARPPTRRSLRRPSRRRGGEAPPPLPPEATGWRGVFHPKILSCIDRAYWRSGRFVHDVMAGVIVGVVALPLAVAFAVASGVGPERGLATAIVAGFLISLLGGSRVQIGGPTGAFIVIVLGVAQRHGFDGLAVSTMMAGVMLIGFGLLKLGQVITFIPHPVIVGFTSGIALTIFSTQVKDALGLAAPPEAGVAAVADAGPGGPDAPVLSPVPGPPGATAPAEAAAAVAPAAEGESGGFLHQWHDNLSRLGEAEPWAVALTVLTIVLVAGGKRWFGKVPGSLVAIVLTTVLTALFDLPVETIGSRFDELPRTLSFAWPAIEWGRLGNYVQPAFTIAMLGAIESLLSAVVADGMIGGRHRSNTELVAQGVANVVSPLFGGIPATGAIARTATNVKNGGRTPVAGLVHALTLLAILFALGPYAAMIPLPCLAGVLMVVAYNMSEWRSFAAILGASRAEAAVLAATFLLTVLVDLTVAIEIGMVMAAFLFVQRMASLGTVFNATADADGERADMVEDYSALPDGVDVFEISGPFFFAAARRYQEVLQGIGRDAKVAIIRMRHVPFVDTTGMRNFTTAIRFMRARGCTVLLSGVRPAVLRDLARHGVVDLVGRDRIHRAFPEAVADARVRLAAAEGGADAGGA